MEHIDWIAVAVAALVTFVVGGPWYSPAMFLKAWQQEMNINESQPGHPAKVFGLAYLFSFVSCALLATLIAPHAGAVVGLKAGLLVGLCFVTASYGINYQFANRSFKALFIDGGYHTLQFAGFGVVLGAWPW